MVDEDWQAERVRRSRGLLELDIEGVCQAFANKEIELPEGKFLTPYIAGKTLKEIDVLDEAPSSGAVAAIFERWERDGKAVFRRNPHAFLAFTEADPLKRD